MEIIKYSDLFDEQGLNSGLTNLIGQITKVRSELQGMIKEIKESATDLNKALSNTSSSTKNGRDDTNKQAEQVEKLYAAYKQLGLGVKYCEDNLKNLLIAHDKLTKATKLSETANKASADSVDRLKAQIELAKLALEGMSEEQRKTSNEGKWLMDVISLLSDQVRGYKQAIKEAENADKESAKAKSEQANATEAQTQALENQYQALFKQANLAEVFEELGISAKAFNSNILGTIDAQGKLTRALNLADVAYNSNADSMAKAKAQAELAKIALDGLTSSDRANTQEGQILTNAVKELNAQIKLYESSLKKSATETTSVSNAMEEQKNETISLQSSYSSLSALIDETGVNIEQLLQTERQQSIATKNGVVANNSLSGSYNQLYAQYNLVKNVLNAMSDEMRKAEGVGKKWEAEALRMMNAMKNMQEATGKHTLSVGDYSKALNGLNIATTQVLREVPVLANSFQQFLVAISNNIPIFVDQLTAVKNATGSWAIAVKGAVAVLFSWQTALLAVLTLLPMIVRKIDEKKKAQQEANKITSEAIELEELLLKAYLDIYKSAERNAAKLRTLNDVARDENRTMEERIKAAKLMKEEYEDAFRNYSAEEIALGKADIAYQNLTKTLMEQAKAKAYLNQITELYEQRIELELKGAERLEEAQKKLTQAQSDYEASKTFGGINNEGATVSLTGNIREAEDELKSLQKELTDGATKIDEALERLISEIPIMGLEFGKTSGRVKRSLDEQKDYFYEWAEGYISILNNTFEKELYMSDLKFAKEKENYQKLIDEGKKAGTLTAEQEATLTDIILNLENQRIGARLAIIREFEEKRIKLIKDSVKNLQEELEEEEVSIKIQAEEEDSFVSIFDSHKNDIAIISNKILESRKNLNDAINKNNYKSAKEEGKIFQQLLEDKLRAEAEYQKELLRMRFVGGELTKAEYDKELSDIEVKLNKNIANLSKTRKNKKFDLWTMMFGKTQEDGKGNVFKELSDEAKMFVGAFEESMSMAFDYMNEWMDKRMEMADVAIEAAQKESEAAKTALDYEMEARANGYANNVSLARQEYEEKLAIEQEAIREKERLAKIQEGVDSAMQLSSLITAAAELWASHASIPVAGPALAIAATALMFGSFAAAKIQAFQASKAKAYGQGGMEYINYGGSHASGKDVDFGRTKDGRPRRIERGEIVGIINKKNVEKYGVRNIENIINSLNKGTFERDYEHDSTASILDMFRTDSSSISSFTSEDNVLTLLQAMDSGKPISFEELALIMAIKALEAKKAEKRKSETENIVTTTNSEEMSLFKLDESSKVSKMNMSDTILSDSVKVDDVHSSSNSEESKVDSMMRTSDVILLDSLRMDNVKTTSSEENKMDSRMRMSDVLLSDSIRVDNVSSSVSEENKADSRSEVSDVILSDSMTKDNVYSSNSEESKVDLRMEMSDIILSDAMSKDSLISSSLEENKSNSKTSISDIIVSDSTRREELASSKSVENNSFSKMKLSDILLMDSLTMNKYLSSSTEENSNDSVAKMIQTLASSLSEEKSYKLISDSSISEDSIVTRLSDKLHSTSELLSNMQVSKHSALEDEEYSRAYESIVSALSNEKSISETLSKYNEILSNTYSSDELVNMLKDEVIMTNLRSEVNKTAILSELFSDDSLVSKASKEVLKTIFMGNESTIQTKEEETYAKRVFGDVLNSTNAVSEFNSEKNKELSDTIKKSTMSSIFDSILHHSDVVESTKFNTISDMYSTAFDTTSLLGGDVDLSNIEKGLSTLISQNDLKVVETPYGRIEYRGNNKRIIRNS